MVYFFFVHSTTNISSTLYDVATDFPGERPPPRRRGGQSKEAIREQVAEKFDRLGRNIDQKVAHQMAHQDAIKEKLARHVEQLDRLQERLGTLEVWLRTEPGGRKPRFSRDEIARAAVKIADAEGFPAVSMRRIAAELDAGTMTLYHYVRTKDELLTLVTDAVMGEVVVPDDVEIPTAWREAITLIAHRSRDAMLRHPWMFDITDDPAVGPNGVRHFDQTMQAVAHVPADFETKLDIVLTVDEFVFGYSLQERNNSQDSDRAILGSDMVDYVNGLIATGDYPQLAELASTCSTEEIWSRIAAHMRDRGRFDRNLARILDGFEADFASA
jgi:AcrR family transcriptional regulator